MPEANNPETPDFATSTCKRPISPVMHGNGVAHCETCGRYHRAYRTGNWPRAHAWAKNAADAFPRDLYLGSMAE